MGKKKKFLAHNRYSSPFTGPHFSRKHAFKQVNGETQMTQNTIFLQSGGMRRQL